MTKKINAENFRKYQRTFLDDLQFKQEEYIITRNKIEIAVIIPFSKWKSINNFSKMENNS